MHIISKCFNYQLLPFWFSIFYLYLGTKYKINKSTKTINNRAFIWNWKLQSMPIIYHSFPYQISPLLFWYCFTLILFWALCSILRMVELLNGYFLSKRTHILTDTDDTLYFSQTLPKRMTCGLPGQCIKGKKC